MAGPTEFTKFSALPTELRLNIWESVAPPTRILGLQPCSECVRADRTPGRDLWQVQASCQQAKHPDWRLRWVVGSANEAVFPLLHACRESRSAWLPRYYCPPRYIRLDASDTGEDLTHEDEDSWRSIRLRFDVPFVNYETDIFTIFDAEDFLFGLDDDPFLGFDRGRIRKIGITENARTLEDTIAAIQPQGLPSLKTITVLILGPDSSSRPGGRRSVNTSWREMGLADMQHTDCGLLDVPDSLIVQHPLFGQRRLRRPYFEPDPMMRHLVNYMVYFRAWLWHAMHWDVDGLRAAQEEISWWDFHRYLFEGPVDDNCPLQDLPQWCPGNHTKAHIKEDNLPFTVDVKMLVEKTCMKELISTGALALDPTGQYESFTRFTKTWLQ
ncbi:hypothetical protein BX600DRAFT_505919 [Xylariales sp. PMI_506]|nr:hypothetical protein BX600DRAFT_505919 [Xylariales sp. PMI_506]